MVYKGLNKVVLGREYPRTYIRQSKGQKARFRGKSSGINLVEEVFSPLGI